MIERRVELRKKIEKRRDQVIKALEFAVAQGAPAERCNGLSTELQVVDNALSVRLAAHLRERLREGVASSR